MDPPMRLHSPTSYPPCKSWLPSVEEMAKLRITAEKLCAEVLEPPDDRLVNALRDIVATLPPDHPKVTAYSKFVRGSPPPSSPSQSRWPSLPEPWKLDLSTKLDMSFASDPVVTHKCSDAHQQRIKQYFGSVVYMHYLPLARNGYHKFYVGLMYKPSDEPEMWYKTTSFELCDVGALAQAAFIKELVVHIIVEQPQFADTPFFIRFV